MNATELAEAKKGERELWATGDYAAIAREMLWDVGAFLVDRLGVTSRDRVLDVACGTGNAAIRAADAGAQVVGVDLTPELFGAGRKLAAVAGVEVEWVEGDAEGLPAEGESFELQFEQEAVEFQFGSVERALETYETDWGAFVKARELLEPQARWSAVRAELMEVLERRQT